MSYSADLYAVQRRSATFVDRILKGADPANLPVEQPTQVEFAVNMRTAKAVGITIPPTLAAAGRSRDRVTHAPRGRLPRPPHRRPRLHPGLTADACTPRITRLARQLARRRAPRRRDRRQGYRVSLREIDAWVASFRATIRWSAMRGSRRRRHPGPRCSSRRGRR
jgi:hypothetical protein